MPALYTPQSNTPQGNQLAQSQAQMATAGFVPQMDASEGQLGQALVGSTQQLSQMQTPEQRAGYLGNTEIAPMQANYDALARQLYEYDKAVLQPQYASNPGVASDVLGYGRVAPSQLQQLTPEAAANPTLFADNPKYAIASQTNAGNNILDVLDALNVSISKEFSSARGKYASTVQSQKDLVNTITNLLTGKREERLTREKLAVEREKIAADREIAMMNKAVTQRNDMYDMAYKLKTNLQGRRFQNQTALDEEWENTVNSLQQQYPSVTRAEIETALGSKPNYETMVTDNLTAGERTIAGSSKTALGLIDQMVQKGGLVENTKTGLLPAVFENLYGKAGQVFDPNLSSFRSATGILELQVKTVLTGKGANEKEMEKIMALVPSINKSKKRNILDLVELQNWLKTQYSSNTGLKYSPDSNLQINQ